MKFAAIYTILLIVPLALSADNSTISTATKTTPTTPVPAPPTTTTTTTVAPITTTTTATTTTATTTPTTTTTTTKPTPPTTPAPNTTTTTAKPAPAPPVPKPPKNIPSGQWQWPLLGNPCMMAHFGAAMWIPYETNNNTIANATIIVPANATAMGDCNNGTLIIMWPAESFETANSTNKTNVLALTFEKVDRNNKTQNAFDLRQAMALIHVENNTFPNAKPTEEPAQILLDAPQFEAPINNSYRCFSERQFPAMAKGITEYNATFIFRDVQFQPFKHNDSTVFSAAYTCDMDKGMTSDVVPIAVGCALAGLVVIVIVAYIIGRRRSRQNGYTSV